MSRTIRKAALKLGISRNKQSAYSTALPNAAIDESHTFEGTLLDDDPTKFNNAGQVGKGHTYPTWEKNQNIDVKGTFATDLSSYIAAYIAAFSMGKIVTEKVVGTTNVYRHTISMMAIDDPLVGKQLPVTTWIYGIDSALQKKYRDLCFKSFAISGKTGEQLKITSEIIGSGHFEILSTLVEMPDLVTTSFLRMCDINFMYKNSSISGELSDFNYKHTNVLAEKTGYYPGAPFLDPADDKSPQVRGRLYCTDSQDELTFKVLMDPDKSYEMDVLKNTVSAVNVSAEGEIIETTYKHKFELIIPELNLKSKKIGENEGLYEYDITTTIHWNNTLNNPCQIIVQNDVADYLSLPA